MQNPELVLETLPVDLEATLQLGYALISRGSLETARDVFDGLTRQPLESEHAQQVGRGLNRIGDVLLELENVPGALMAYRAGLEIRQVLAQRDLGNMQWQRDVSLTHDNIGDALQAKGDSFEALAAYRTSLEIAAALAQRDPGNTEWQRDLAVIHNQIGDVLLGQEDSRGALAAYRAGLDIAQSLVHRDPENVEWQRDLSISHHTIGDALVEQGHGRKARASYLAGLEILESWRFGIPRTSNGGWTKRDFSPSWPSWTA